jgi:hypothetical protein
MVDGIDTPLAGAPVGPGMLYPTLQAAYQRDPRRLLVESIMQTGREQLQQPTLSPGAMLAKALTGIIGGASGAMLEHEYQAQNAGAQDTLRQAIAAPDLATQAKILAGNPATAPQGMSLSLAASQARLKTMNEQDAEMLKQGFRTVRASDGSLLAITKDPGYEKGKADIAGAVKKSETGGEIAAKTEGEPGLIKATIPAKAAEAGAIENAKVPGQSQVNANKVRDEAAVKTSSVAPGTVVVQDKPNTAGVGSYVGNAGGATNGTAAPGAATGAIQPELPGPPPPKPAVPDGAAPPVAPAPAAPAVPVAKAGAELARSEYPPADVLGPRQKRFETVMQSASDAHDEMQKAQLLKDQLHQLGMGGPAIPFLGNLSRWAENMGVAPETIAKYGLPNGATEQTAQKLSTDLLGEVLKAQFPQRITNNDIKLFQNTVPGPGMMPQGSDYLFDNIIVPRVQRDIGRGRAIVDLPGKDPGLASLERTLMDYNDKNPLSSFTPALKPKPSPQDKLSALEAEMKRRGLPIPGAAPPGGP